MTSSGEVAPGGPMVAAGNAMAGVSVRFDR